MVRSDYLFSVIGYIQFVGILFEQCSHGVTCYHHHKRVRNNHNKNSRDLMVFVTATELDSNSVVTAQTAYIY